MSTMPFTAIFAPSNMLVPPPGICPDAYFNAHTQRGLVWLPSVGMGWLDVQEDPATVYNADYWQTYVGYANTEQGRRITAARCALVDRWMLGGGTLVDVGIGCGDFLSARPGAWGCDINPIAIDWLRTRNRFASPYTVQVDALTFFDSMEHIPDVHKMLANARRWVFCTVPIVPGEGPPRPDWRHFRTTEHCWFWTYDGLIAWMKAQGFACVEHNTMESLLGRLDSHTFVFRRVSP